MDLLNKHYPRVAPTLPCHTIRAISSNLPLVEAAIRRFDLADEIAEARMHYDSETIVVVSIIRKTDNGPMIEVMHHHDSNPEEELADLSFLHVDDGRHICATYDSSADITYSHVEIVVE